MKSHCLHCTQYSLGTPAPRWWLDSGFGTGRTRQTWSHGSASWRRPPGWPCRRSGGSHVGWPRRAAAPCECRAWTRRPAPWAAGGRCSTSWWRDGPWHHTSGETGVKRCRYFVCIIYKITVLLTRKEIIILESQKSHGIRTKGGK